VKYMADKKTKKDKKEETEKEVEDPSSFFVDFAKTLEAKTLRITGVYGDITEEKCSETIYGLVALDNDKKLVPVDEEDPDSEIVEKADPIEFYISTFGGAATEMFAVYDMMRKVQKETEIHTFGIGKVMSAGVLLLAAGTKGHRKIGKNCRVMIHGVISGQQGHLQDVENEFEEAKLTQKLYIRALAKETDMTEKYIKKLMDRKTNVYLDAEQAVELGIADIVF
jgi:ATP-dependent Clp endopeptidase proteolytic subunit ClpP